MINIFSILIGCASGNKPAPEDTQNSDICLQYPIVMAHGIGRNDTGKRMHPWGRIPEVLQEHGVKVYFGNTDAWGSIESNAESLKESIDKILEETEKEKVNIIAHSKGGIDSRYLIWKYDYGDRVASLTTISTPHRGCELADLLYSKKIIHTKRGRRRLETFGKLFGDDNPDIYTVSCQLTTENMEKFNDYVTIDERVYYQSIYVTMNHPSVDPIFSRSHKYIQGINGANDGLISEYSAKWGPNTLKIADNISHEQIIGHGGKKIPGMKIPNIYLDIIRGLGERGL